MYCKAWQRKGGVIGDNACSAEMLVHHSDFISCAKAEKRKNTVYFFPILIFFRVLVSGPFTCGWAKNFAET